jgi:REP element-mobilizing transposase RayT
VPSPPISSPLSYVRLKKGLPSLRGTREQRVLVEAFRRVSDRSGFRLVHYSVQSNHAHLLVEAHNRDELSRGMCGLASCMARSLNRLWRRRGTVFADRYHDQILRTPPQVRNALRYVLNNARKHRVPIARTRPDPCSSGRWFDGWRDWKALGSTAPVVRARTWLLNVGWRRHRLIGLSEVPGG